MNAAPELSQPDVIAKLAELHGVFGVPVDLHAEDDLLFRFFRNQTPGVEAVVRCFESGFGDATQIAYTMRSLLPDVTRPRVLEFAAGFGRMSRHFRKTAPNADLVISDIHAPAIEFARQRLGLSAIKSEGRPADVTIDADRYDFVFALSFFSHMPDALFYDWLALLYSSLRLGGYLLFTTHGEASMRTYPHLAAMYDASKGHGYALASDQPDIEGDNYGTATTGFDYVLRHIKSTPARLVGFRSAAWWGHQDEWIVQKPPQAAQS